MKQQGSLITTLLVILESIAVVGFLFLIFAVSSSSNVGKYKYQLQVKSQQDGLKPLPQAVILADDQGKNRSFHTDDEGFVQFRSKQPLTMVTISASEHFTQSFELDPNSGEAVLEDIFVLESIAKDTLKTLTQVVKAVSIVNEEDQPITDAVVTLQSEKPARSFQYDPSQEAYPIVVSHADTEIRFSVSAPGYASQFGIRYDDNSPTVILQKQPNLNLPFQFTISVYDAEANADYSSLDEVAVTDPQAATKKALDKAVLSVDQGAVIKSALGTFQVFSRKAENAIQVHAPQYVPQAITLKSAEKADNHYRVFLKKNKDTFSHKLLVKTYDDQKNAMSAVIQTDANAAVQKDQLGIYRIFTNDPKLEITIDAVGFIPQKLMLFPEKQTEYQVALKAQSQHLYSINVTDPQKQPIENAIVTLLSDPPKTGHTDPKGKVTIESNRLVSNAMIVAPGFLSQNVTLPKTKKKNSIRATYELTPNPMASVSHTFQVKVLDEKKHPLAASISSSSGFISQEKLGQFQVMSATSNLKLTVSAPGYQEKLVDVARTQKNNRIQVQLQKSSKQLGLIEAAKHTIRVKVLDEKGKAFNASVGSTEGFVRQEQKGHYQVFSPTQNFFLNVSAPGYEHQTIGLSAKQFGKPLTVPLKKFDEEVQQMQNTPHKLQIKVVDEKKQPLMASVMSNVGFVKQKEPGYYQIFSPTRELTLGVSAPGYEHQSLILDSTNFQTDLSVALKKLGEPVQMMAAAKHQLKVNVVDEKNKPLGANVVSNIGFVKQEKYGSYQIFSKSRDLALNISAPGYSYQTLVITPETHQSPLTVQLQKIGKQVELMSSADHSVKVKVLNEQGEALVANVSSNNGFVKQEQFGTYQIFSTTPHLQVNISASGYEDQSISLDPKTFKETLTVSLKKIDDSIKQLASAKHKARIHVFGGNGQPLSATVSSNAGFVKQEQKGTYRIFSPTQEITLNISAPGHTYRTVNLKPNNFKESLNVTLKPIETHVQSMANANHEVQITISDEKGNPLLVNLASDQGFVTQEKVGTYRIFSPTQQLQVNVSAEGYKSQAISFTPKTFKKEFAVSLEKIEQHVELMTTANQKMRINVVDDKGNALVASISSDQGFVKQEGLGRYQVYSPTKELTLNVAAPGYEPQALSFSNKTFQKAKTVKLKKIEGPVKQMALAEHQIRVNVADRQGTPLLVNVASNHGFVTQEKVGSYQIFSPTQKLQINVSASGYKDRSIILTPQNFKKALNISLEKTDNHVEQMATVTQSIQVSVIDKRGKALVASISSDRGFVKQEGLGRYQIFSPTKDLTLNVAAPGYEPQTHAFSAQSFKNSVTVKLKKIDEQVQQMAQAEHQMRIKVFDGQGKRLPATIASTAGFVHQEQSGIYQVFTPTRDLTLDISAPGFQNKSITLSPANFKPSLNVSLSKVEKRVEMMASMAYEAKVTILDEKGEPLLANVSSSQGFIKQHKRGEYHIFSPSSDLQMTVSANGYQTQTLALPPKAFKQPTTITLKKAAEQMGLMASAEYKSLIRVFDDKRKRLRATVSSTAGFVKQEQNGIYQVFSPTRDFTLNVSAPGYEEQTFSVTPNNFKSALNIYLKKMDNRLSQMASAKHQIQIKVFDKKGKLIQSNVSSDHGFVQKEQKGRYQIYSTTPNLKINVSAPGYKSKTQTLAPRDFKSPLIVTLEKEGDHVELLTEAKHQLQIKVLDEKGKPLLATVSSNVGFVNRNTNGTYQVYSPTQDLALNVTAPGYEHQTVTLSKKTFKGDLKISLKKESVSQQVHQMASATHDISVEVFDENNKPLNANVASTLGFVSQRRNGLYKIFTPSYDMQISVIAPGYEPQTVDLSSQVAKDHLKITLQKSQSGVVLNTEVGDRLILSKGVVYRVIQPIDKKTVRVFRRTDPAKGEFNDFPSGKVMSINQFNREIEIEKDRKNFFDENVWVTVYALNKKEYFLFKDTYRKQWADYKLVYANHR